ncbi:IS200/IS605 family transposase [Bacillus cereus]|uniref:IS200/IS605 family transposase n=1 Tax=Bacillus cereus TaxID=1396 RepID=UPI000B4B7913|nr:IS200/IS605 family transposase [Bacillus cereus]
MQDFSKNRRAIFKLTYHLVVATKYRHPVIKNDIKNRLNEIAHNLFIKQNCTILDINGGVDHIHIQFTAPPTLNLTTVINNFKSVSSRYIRKEFSEELKPFYWKPFFWSNRYMIYTSGDVPNSTIKEYIDSEEI